MLATLRGDADAPAQSIRFEVVAETVFRRYSRVWKPQTLYVNRNYLRRQILPRFARFLDCEELQRIGVVRSDWRGPLRRPQTDERDARRAASEGSGEPGRPQPLEAELVQGVRDLRQGGILH